MACGFRYYLVRKGPASGSDHFTPRCTKYRPKGHRAVSVYLLVIGYKRPCEYLLRGAVSFWETNWFAVSQEIPRISRNPKVNYRTHKRPPFIRYCGKILYSPDRSHMTIRHMSITYRITKATNTHSEYVILIAFPLQRWLHERASLLRYTYRILPVLFSNTTILSALNMRYQVSLLYNNR